MNNYLLPTSTLAIVVKDRIDCKYNIRMWTITPIPTTISRLKSLSTKQTTTYGDENPVTAM